MIPQTRTVPSALRFFSVEAAFFLLALVVGAALRFYALGELPHGLYHDEAYYGLDALDVLNGARPIYFPANNGREPLYIYLLSISLAALGRTPFGLRFASALIGTLTIPVTYLLGRALFSRGVGLLAMWVCAITFWPVALSRVSFRAGALPLFLGLAIALGWLGLQRRKVWLAVLGGAAYGLAFNTYTAARITPLALALFAGIVFLFDRREREARREDKNNDSAISARSAVKCGLAFLLTAAIVVTPLTLYALSNPTQVFAREGQVSIFQTESGNPIWILSKHLGLALGMFGFHGDEIARHNMPGRPVFDVWTFVFFVVGVVVLINRVRRADARSAPTFVLIWLGVTILPTALAEDTPHFLRGIGMLPVLWLVPAVGYEAFIDTQSVLKTLRVSRRVFMAGILLTLSTSLTAYDYFFRYAQSPITHYYFESAATELAQAVQQYPGYAIRIDDRLWDNFASLRFLIADRDGADATDHVLLVVWPHEPEAVRAQVAGLPPGTQISARRGGLARGDLEPTPYSLYTLYTAEPVRAEPVTARFGEAVELHG
ncbi:MAG TPA: glycosyltransferase family 39 protein, partial [Anaerolineales bacterium]|nr:glycosyltransferase family 39 protein [Anaerolineales bacterium]